MNLEGRKGKEKEIEQGTWTLNRSYKNNKAQLSP